MVAALPPPAGAWAPVLMLVPSPVELAIVLVLGLLVFALVRRSRRRSR